MLQHVWAKAGCVSVTCCPGRRHQLRIHTARVLGAPILGDVRYGYAGTAMQLSSLGFCHFL
jgi:23S rRNA-/tRNA-specific pseudouridylate synthase